MKPASGGAFPTATEGDIQVLLPVIVAQCQPNSGENFMLTVSRIIQIPEHAVVRWNANPALT
jgi:hypothetical protein